jgi:hypothetical protein
MKKWTLILAAGMLIFGWALALKHADGQEKAASGAGITRVVIARRHPAFGGKSFGSAGPYEMLVGTAYGEIDPKAAMNRGIVNLQNAPVNAKGHVEYSMDITFLKPVDINKGNGRLIYDVINRGHEKALSDLNLSEFSRTGPEEVQDPATAFIMKRGYTVAWSGWEGERSDEVLSHPGLLKADFPIAMRKGKPITGVNREEITDVPAGPSFTKLLSYPAANLDQAGASLTVREKEADPRKPLPASSWNYVDATHVRINAAPGFDRGALYEFIYPATNPVVEGIAYASIRDFVLFLRHAERDSTGQPNPLHTATPFKAVLGMGVSESGQVVKDFVYQDFNIDGAGQKVFDGIMGKSRSMRNLRSPAAFHGSTRTISIRTTSFLSPMPQQPTPSAGKPTGYWRNAPNLAPAQKCFRSIPIPKSGSGVCRWWLPIPAASPSLFLTMFAFTDRRACRTTQMTSRKPLPEPRTAAFARNCGARCITGTTAARSSWHSTAGSPREWSRRPAVTPI